MNGGFSGSTILQSSPLEKYFFPFLPWNSCLQRQLCLEKPVKVKISIAMNFVAKCCQPPGILGDFAVDRWKFIGFTRPGILRPSPCTDKKWNSPLDAENFTQWIGLG